MRLMLSIMRRAAGLCLLLVMSACGEPSLPTALFTSWCSVVHTVTGRSRAAGTAAHRKRRASSAASSRSAGSGHVRPAAVAR